ncbi:MAG: lysine transporter LysE [Dehalococcoidales bacterium]|nr:lysine transporter LysE [Dehalococcoidales bacterium]MDP6576276.1 LysE family transporter [Dehalococcoidales bacterium]MDP6825109.1 LysE family transporter [Dehalococcoidales bacterium]|tara:strand:+ start:257 stop:868 length:612 start_codon:yes stop_codon:yes gene_type:complete
MLPILLSVVIISFSGVMMPGPMFAITLAKSYKSQLAGTQISLGHAVIEVPLILLIYFGFAQFFQNVIVQLVLSVAGSGMIIWLGISMFRARTEVVRKGKDLPCNAFTAGIITSALNPFFLLWWVTIGSMLIMRILDFGVIGLVVFIMVHWLCDLVWLTLVSIVVYRTHSLWGLKLQEWIFTACSLLLVGFGIWFLVSGIQLVA